MQDLTLGETAGKVWKTLGERQKVSLSRLGQESGCEPELALLACGWLAREGKIQLDREGRQAVVRLTAQEQETYKRSNGGNGNGRGGIT